jgi:hypothetical protein
MTAAEREREMAYIKGEQAELLQREKEQAELQSMINHRDDPAYVDKG